MVLPRNLLCEFRGESCVRLTEQNPPPWEEAPKVKRIEKPCLTHWVSLVRDLRLAGMVTRGREVNWYYALIDSPKNGKL